MLLLLSCSWAESQKISYPHHQLGLSYSSFSGSGFSYLIEINKDYALNANGLIYYQGDKPPDDLDQYGIIGLELQKNFYNSEYTRYYIFAGVGFWYLEERRLNTIKINDATFTTKTKKIDRIWNFGFGPGVEYNFLPRAAISLNVGLLYQQSDNAAFPELFDRSPNSDSYFGFGGSIALRFRF